MPWLWLTPLALVTLWVWLEIAWSWHQRRYVEHVHEWRARVDARDMPPCVYCSSLTHTKDEHVHYTQAELAAREQDPEYFLNGEW